MVGGACGHGKAVRGGVQQECEEGGQPFCLHWSSGNLQVGKYNPKKALVLPNKK